VAQAQSLARIDHGAFSMSKSLNRLDIPASVASIGQLSFRQSGNPSIGIETQLICFCDRFSRLDCDPAIDRASVMLLLLA
jgi:hypothetical protein